MYYFFKKASHDPLHFSFVTCGMLQCCIDLFDTCFMSSPPVETKLCEFWPWDRF